MLIKYLVHKMSQYPSVYKVIKWSSYKGCEVQTSSIIENNKTKETLYIFRRGNHSKAFIKRRNLETDKFERSK